MVQGGELEDNAGTRTTSITPRIRLSPERLVFTPENYSISQYISVEVQDDNILTGSEYMSDRVAQKYIAHYSLKHSVESEDRRWSGDSILWQADPSSLPSYQMDVDLNSFILSGNVTSSARHATENRLAADLTLPAGGERDIYVVDDDKRAVLLELLTNEVPLEGETATGPDGLYSSKYTRVVIQHTVRGFDTYALRDGKISFLVEDNDVPGDTSALMAPRSNVQRDSILRGGKAYAEFAKQVLYAETAIRTGLVVKKFTEEGERMRDVRCTSLLPCRNIRPEDVSTGPSNTAASESDCSACSAGKYCSVVAAVEPTGDCDAGHICISRATIPTPTDGVTGMHHQELHPFKSLRSS
ncbi:UNVERIFIED_CONTAM: hypothetical protein H355_008661 [Colinus virginianus]|nr:hypothetical protein H355_008661 [Colinus virginianus]